MAAPVIVGVPHTGPTSLPVGVAVPNIGGGGMEWSTTLDNETSINDVFGLQVGHASLDSAHPHSGTQSVKITNAGASSAPKRKLRQSPVYVGRFWIYQDTITPAVAQNLFSHTLDSAVNAPALRLSTAGVFQMGFAAGVFQNGPTALLNTYQAVDYRIRVDGATYTIDWMIDGAAQTQATIAAAPSMVDTFTLANSGTNTLNIWFDDIQLSTAPAAYPLPDIQSGGTTNLLTVSLSEAVTAAILNTQTQKRVAVTETATQSVAKFVTKTAIPVSEPATVSVTKLVTGGAIQVSQTAAVSVKKQVGKLLALTSEMFTPLPSLSTLASVSLLPNSTVVSIHVQVGKAMNVSASAAAAVAKAVTHTPIQLTETAAVAVSRQVRKAVIATAATSLTVTGRLVHLLTVALTQSSTVGVSKMVGKTVASSASPAAALAKSVGKAVAVSETAAIAVTKRVSKTVTAAQTSALSVTTRVAHLFAVSLSQPSAVTIAKQVTKTVTAAQTSTVTIAKSVRKIIGVSETAAVSVAAVLSSIIHAVISFFRSSPLSGLGDAPAPAAYIDSPVRGVSDSPSMVVLSHLLPSLLLDPSLTLLPH